METHHITSWNLKLPNFKMPADAQVTLWYMSDWVMETLIGCICVSNKERKSWVLTNYIQANKNTEVKEKNL